MIARPRKKSKRRAGEAPDFVLQCDGASRGNPGYAGAGAVLLTPGGESVEEDYRFLGETTNNQAEYQGLIIGLEMALRHQPSRLTIRLDSELIVRQLEGRYKVRNVGLRPLYEQAMELLAQLPAWSVEHIDRSLNGIADGLANRAIDEAPEAARE